jgi:hypothetical protein
MIGPMGKPGLLGIAVLIAAGCGAEIGGGGEDRPPDGAPITDAAPRPDAAPAFDAAPPCEGGDAHAEGADGTCIVYFATPATWDAARSACAGIGGTLAIIDDQAENNLVATIPPADAVNLPDIWAAGTDAGTEAEWHWLAGGTVFWRAGTTLTYAHWRIDPPEPNNGGGVEHCMVVEGDTIVTGEGYTWDDRPCDRSYSYFCET